MNYIRLSGHHNNNAVIEIHEDELPPTMEIPYPTKKDKLLIYTKSHQTDAEGNVIYLFSYEVDDASESTTRETTEAFSD